MTILLLLLHQRMCWFPLHSWRLFSRGIAIWVDSSFLSAPEKYYSTSFWAPWEISCHSNCFCPIRYPFCIDAFFSPFVFSFQNFDQLGMDFFGFTLVEVHSASVLSRVISFAKFGKHSALISSSLRVINVRSYVILPQTSESLFLFFILFPLCCSNWVISIVLSPSSLTFPLSLSSLVTMSLCYWAIHWVFNFS